MKAALGLGSNVGDRRAHLEGAVRRLGDRARILGVSRFRETAPEGGPAQGPYLNAAVVLETSLDPRGLLELTREIEAAAGRERTVRWGPRTLDIDLLLCDDRIVREPDLEVPHPRLHERRFVLDPLAEVAPHWVVPGPWRSVEDLLADLPDGP